MPAYTRQYTQDVGWENEPSTATPINAANLNKMDDAIGAIDAELAALFGNGIVAKNSYATVAQAGLVKPDGRTITVDSDGEIHATGGGGGASALDDLTDTDITDPATGEVLTYDDVSGKWKNEELPAVPIATTSVAGKVKPDGTTITVDDDGTIHGSSPTLAGLTDTAITTPADGDILRYNSESSKWENEELAEPDGMAKSRFTVSSSGWSASANASGYYTYTVALGTSVNVAYSPTIYLAGASDSTFPTDAERAQYGRLDEAALTAANTVTLYAKTKPTSTFYIFIEIVSAGGAGGVSADNYSTSERIIGTWIDGSTLYEKTIDCGALPSSSGVEKTVSTGLSNVKILDISGVALQMLAANDSISLPLPFTTYDGQGNIQVLARDNNAGNEHYISIKADRDRSGFTGYITIRYIKY